MEKLSLAAARRIALAAQGFAAPRPEGAIDQRHVRRTLKRTQLLQIDSVNVLVRAHYLPLFSRLASALLVPFDPLIWERSRTERLFGLRYRIEIYTPAEKRVHGYYVLPFLDRERIAARLDLKADRQAGVLRVQAAHGEPGAAAGAVDRLAAELKLMVEWLELDRIAVSDRGDLSGPLRRASG